MGLGVLLVPLLIFGVAGDPLTIYTQPSSSAVLGSAALLKCRFNIGGAINLTALQVHWYFSDQSVAQYDRGEEIFAPGVSISKQELRIGNASLGMENIQMSDEGQYTCVVGYGAERQQSETTLHVLAAPRLSIPRRAARTDTATSFPCHVWGFYPGDVTVTWLRDGRVLTDTTRSAPQSNPDGTFNLTLTYTFTPIESDSSSIFSCRVSHAALAQPLQEEFPLDVTVSRAGADHTSAAIGATLGILVAGGAAAAIAIYCWRKRREGPYSAVETPAKDAAGSGDKTRGEDTVGMGNEGVSGAGEGSEQQPLLPAQGQEQSETQEQEDRLQVTGRSDSPGSELSECQERGKAVAAAPGPRAPGPNGDSSANAEAGPAGPGMAGASAELAGQQGRDAAPSITTVGTRETAPNMVPATAQEEDVQGEPGDKGLLRPPEVSEISQPQSVTAGEEITLSYRMRGHFPADLSVTWLRRDRGAGAAVPLQDSDQYKIESGVPYTQDWKSFQQETRLSFTPSVQTDQGAEFICRVRHKALQACLERRSGELQIAGPSSAVETPPEDPAGSGDKTCGEDTVGMGNDGVSDAGEGSEQQPLLHGQSQEQSETQEQDGAQGTGRSDSPGSELSECQERGKAVAAAPGPRAPGPNGDSSANAEAGPAGPGMAGASAELAGQQGRDAAPSITTVGTRETAPNMVPATAQEEDVQGEPGDKGLLRPPEVSEISQPQSVTAGEEITLSCRMRGHFPADLSVTWLRRDRGAGAAVPLQDSDQYKIESGVPYTQDWKSFQQETRLSFTPSVQTDQGAEFICRVRHKALQACLERRSGELQIAGLLRPPEVSEISQPESVTAGEEIVLSCRMTGHYPAALSVTWLRRGRGAGAAVPLQGSAEYRIEPGAPHTQDWKSFQQETRLSFTPSVQRDQGAEYVCRVGHVALQTPLERRSRELQVTGCANSAETKPSTSEKRGQEEEPASSPGAAAVTGPLVEEGAGDTAPKGNTGGDGGAETKSVSDTCRDTTMTQNDTARATPAKGGVTSDALGKEQAGDNTVDQHTSSDTSAEEQAGGNTADDTTTELAEGFPGGARPAIGVVGDRVASTTPVTKVAADAVVGAPPAGGLDPEAEASATCGGDDADRAERVEELQADGTADASPGNSEQTA